MTIRQFRYALLASSLAAAASVALAGKPVSPPAAPTGEVVDAAGKTLGHFFWHPSTSNTIIDKFALVNINGVITSVTLTSPDAGGWTDYAKLVPYSGYGSVVYFANPGCTGQAYLMPDTAQSIPGAAPAVTRADGVGAGYVYVSAVPMPQPSIASVWSHSSSLTSCTDYQTSGYMIPVAQIVDLATLFVAPYLLK